MRGVNREFPVVWRNVFNAKVQSSQACHVELVAVPACATSQYR